MIEPWLIDLLKRQEEEERRRREEQRPQLEIPVPEPEPVDHQEHEDRGVVTIQFL